MALMIFKLEIHKSVYIIYDIYIRLILKTIFAWKLPQKGKQCFLYLYLNISLQPINEDTFNISR
jgi:hypothetical protein